MATGVSNRCKCGRIAVWIGAISGEPECGELADLRRHPTDKKMAWYDTYKVDRRHEREQDGT